MPISFAAGSRVALIVSVLALGWLAWPVLARAEAAITAQQAVRETLGWASGSSSEKYLDETYDRIERAAYRHSIIPEFALAVVAAEARYGQGISWARYTAWNEVEVATGISHKPYRNVLDDLDTALSELRVIMEQSTTVNQVLESYWCGADGQFNQESLQQFIEAASKLWNGLKVFAEQRVANEDRNKYTRKYQEEGRESSPAWAGLAYGDLEGYSSKLNSMPELASQLETFPGFEENYARVAQKFNKKLSYEEAVVISRAIFTYCKQTDWAVDPRLVMALVSAESSFRPGVVSKVGAIGLGQLMPATARSLGIKDPFDPIQNLYGCVKYLERETYRWKGNLDCVLASYNAGAGAVQKYGGVPPYSETRAYVTTVKRRYYQLAPEMRK